MSKRAYYHIIDSSDTYEYKNYTSKAKLKTSILQNKSQEFSLKDYDMMLDMNIRELCKLFNYKLKITNYGI